MVLALALATPGAAASAAIGDGLPIQGEGAGPGSVADPTKGLRYVALNAGGGTVVARVASNGGHVYGYTFMRGRFVIPAVALDGSAAAISKDGGTLVLIRPRGRFPQSHTRFVILDPRRLRARDRLTLRGDFSFDAISPDGSLMYLVQYLSRRDPTRYAVRAYDLSADRLLPDPIVDPHKPDERMGGFPITRATSPDGRWAYTLYDGAGKEPFVHALDTVGRTAACIDLPTLAGHSRLTRLRLALSGQADRLFVNDRGRALAVVDTRTFRVSEPAASGKADGVGVAELASLAAAAALLGAGVLSLAFRRRRRLAAT
jgi:hypothetical protein